MDKQCPTGFFLDSLLKQCIAQDTQQQEAVTEAVMSTIPPVQCWNFTVWISVCVVVVLSSTVLVLLHWVIINRRNTQGKGKRNSACQDSHHVNTNSYGKEDSCLPMKQEVSDGEMGWGRGFCKTGVEPAVPLPATELGDSALVTTKTVQLVDYSHCDAS
ncbi:hypothetical protein Q7C36_004087 [Tachysurus vachellii]|uniref:Uncharacterized protein n=1 Tax=Tachysurus vachellii TaxID=175792 RepID=A0AA88NR80_TACVA|nr:hypothetical protein Q7C36_004087 [Tachysurus vachellii]